MSRSVWEGIILLIIPAKGFIVSGTGDMNVMVLEREHS